MILEKIGGRECDVVCELNMFKYLGSGVKKNDNFDLGVRNKIK